MGEQIQTWGAFSLLRFEGRSKGQTDHHKDKLWLKYLALDYRHVVDEVWQVHDYDHINDNYILETYEGPEKPAIRETKFFPKKD